MKSEVERFRQLLPTLEILASARLTSRHWVAMSAAIGGGDLSHYANATIVELSTLDLSAHLAKLRPIAAAAEREGAIVDQVQAIADFWGAAAAAADDGGGRFAMETYAQYWHLQAPTNLEALIESADAHCARLARIGSGEEATAIEGDSDVAIHAGGQSEELNAQLKK